MNLLRVTAAVLLLTIPTFSLFATADEKITCSTLYKEIWAHSQEAMNAGERGTDYFFWGRARLAIEATPNETLEKVFSKMSKKDLEELFWGVKTGDIKATRQEDKMIEELWHMVEELGDKPFWGNVPDRGFAIREALRKSDMKHAYSGDPAFAAQFTDQALGQTEIEVLGRALSEHEKNAKFPNSKWYDRIVRFFSPHYDKVQEVLETNNSIRRRLQKMYEIDKPALEAIPKYKDSLNLTSDELKELQHQVSDTAGQLSEARNDILNLYGREVSSTKPLPAPEIRIRDLAKKAKSTETVAEEAKLGQLAENDMDTIDRVVGQAWNRKNGVTTGMPIAEKNDVHLQIRNPQYRRETPQRRAAYLNVTENRTPAKANYDVETEWTVTVQHEEPKTRQVSKTVYNEKGEATGTEWVTEHYTDYYSTTYGMSRRDVLEARYEEVLNNSVRPSDHIGDLPSLPTAQTRGSYAVSASNGSPSIGYSDKARISQILDQGKNARASEAPYRNMIADATAVVDSVTDPAYQAALKKPGEIGRIEQNLTQTRAKLADARDLLKAYGAKDATAVNQQWAQDKPKDFLDRNLQMITRYTHMINRIDHLVEQVKRESPSLEIQFQLPNYQPQLDRLKAIKDKNKRIIVRSSVAAGAAAVGTTGYIYREEAMSAIRDLTGHDSDR